jgi:hypothetical protein
VSRWVLGGCSRSCEFDGVVVVVTHKNEVGVGQKRDWRMDNSNVTEWALPASVYGRYGPP